MSVTNADTSPSPLSPPPGSSYPPQLGAELAALEALAAHTEAPTERFTALLGWADKAAPYAEAALKALGNRADVRLVLNVPLPVPDPSFFSLMSASIHLERLHDLEPLDSHCPTS